MGKSTISVHLAAWFHQQGVDVALLDADINASSSQWIVNVEPDIYAEHVIDANIVRKVMKSLQSRYHVVVIDGPGGLAELNLRILLAADMAILPCGPTDLDLRASELSINVIKEAQDTRDNGLPKALFVPNRVQVNTLLSSEMMQQTERDIGIPVARTPIRLLQAYADAPGQGKTVFQMGYRGKDAADDLHNLFTEIMTYAGAT